MDIAGFLAKCKLFIAYIYFYLKYSLHYFMKSNTDSVQKAFDTCKKENYEYVINCAAETKHGHNDAVRN